MPVKAAVLATTTVRKPVVPVVRRAPVPPRVARVMAAPAPRPAAAVRPLRAARCAPIAPTTVAADHHQVVAVPHAYTPPTPPMALLPPTAPPPPPSAAAASPTSVARSASPCARPPVPTRTQHLSNSPSPRSPLPCPGGRATHIARAVIRAAAEAAAAVLGLPPPISLPFSLERGSSVILTHTFEPGWTELDPPVAVVSPCPSPSPAPHWRDVCMPV